MDYFMLVMKQKIIKLKKQNQTASLTVEAALVMPLFLYFIIAFLYFIQIFTLQEQVQTGITKMALDLSKAAYFYKDFPDLNEAYQFDKTIFPCEISSRIDGTTDRIMSGETLHLYAKKYLNVEKLNTSCIKGGYDGIDFSCSSIWNKEEIVDITLKYKVTIPLKIFQLGEISMLQRVKGRAWTGYEIEAVYNTNKDSNQDNTVYITETGTVYHKSKECSHIKLSIRSVNGIPYDLRNENGAKYYACEVCGSSGGEFSLYYITSDGNRYHTTRNCSKLKRSIKEIPISEVGSRKPCSRCGK